MTQIKKFAWYGSSVGLAVLMAVAILVATPTKTAEAAVQAATALGGVPFNADPTLARLNLAVGAEANFSVVTDANDTVTVQVDRPDRANIQPGGVATSSYVVNNTTDTSRNLRGIATGAVRVEVLENGVIVGGWTVTVVAAQPVVTTTLGAAPALTAFGTGAITATTNDATNTPVAGSSVEFAVTGNAVLFKTTAAGTTCSATATAFTATSCTATAGRSGGTVGQATAGLQATAASGGYSVTATSNGTTDSATGGIAATVDAVSVSSNRSTLQDTTIGVAGTTVATVTATATAAGESPLAGQNINFSVAGSSGAQLSLTSACGGLANTQTVAANNSGNANVFVCTTAAETPGNTAIVTASVTTGSTTRTGSTTITIAGAAANVTITGPDTVPVSGTAQYTVKVTDSGDRPVGGLGVTTNVTGAVQGNAATLIGTATNADGEIPLVFVHGGATVGSATITVSTNTGTGFGSKVIGIGQAPSIPTEPGDGSFEVVGGGELNDEGPTEVRFGGTIAELDEVVEDNDVVAVFVFDNATGRFLAYFPDVTVAIVNADFLAKFPSGVPADTTMYFVK